MRDDQKGSRGRPSTGNAKTAADRQAAYRTRKKAEIEALKRDVTKNIPPSIGRMEAQIILLNAELLTRSDELEVARREIAALKNKSKNQQPGVDILPVIPTKASASIVRELTEAQALRKKKLAQIAKLQKDADSIDGWFRQTVASCKNL